VKAETKAKVWGAVRALPVALWVIMAAIVGFLLVLAGVKRRAGAEGAAAEGLRRAKERGDRIREDAARGNDAAVQGAFGDAVQGRGRKRR
jgi:hypothetical protein